MATAKVNVESKNHLARILARENLQIQHRKVKTASFELVSRTLTLPIWKDMSSELYTFLVAHEISHALYSGKDPVNVIAARIDPNNPNIAGTYWNIVEDPRVERLVQSLYPGLRRDFAIAYKDLFDRDLFGISGVDVNALPFIDRINLYFKIGAHLPNLKFSPLEQLYVDRVATILTLTESIELAKEIYEFAKHEHPQNPMSQAEMDQLMEALKKMLQDKNGGGNDDEDDDSDTGITIRMPGAGSPKEGEGDGEDDGDDAGQKPGNPTSGKGKDTKKDAGADEESESGAESEGDGKGNKKDGKSKKKTSAASTNSNIPGGIVPPMASTQAKFDNQLEGFIDSTAKDQEYLDLPNPDLKTIIVPNEVVHQQIRKRLSPADIAKAQVAYNEFRTSNAPTIEYILQEFELKKQADQYKRIKRHKTGSLDVLRLWSYKFEDDLFKTIDIVSDGKNHGLIFIVDWSSSMTGNMPGTLEQLIVLCLFCRQADIPFQVFSLTVNEYGIKAGNTGKAFSRQPGTPIFTSEFRMRCYLDSAMTNREFTDACVNLFSMMPNGCWSGGGADGLTGCTPLNEAVVATIALTEQFRMYTKAQVINAVFLTDGGANTVSAYTNKNGADVQLDRNTKYIINDRYTHKVYEFDGHHMTPILLQILRDRLDMNVVGFYIGGSYHSFFDMTKRTPEQTKDLARQFTENGYVISEEWGYNELYITSGVERVKASELVPTVTDPKTKMSRKLQPGDEGYADAYQVAFSQQRRAMTKQRMMLDRFVTMIS